jgi:hypothetical protein
MIQLEARVLRVDPKGPSSRRSATIVLRALGHLAVQVFFHADPTEGVKVSFAKATDDDQAGDAVGGELTTDDNGVARLDYAVDAGHYVCRVERQPPLLVTTVDDPAQPYPIVLPVGRPYVDLDGDVEFAAGEREE